MHGFGIKCVDNEESHRDSFQDVIQTRTKHVHNYFDVCWDKNWKKMYTLWISSYALENNCLHTNFGSE